MIMTLFKKSGQMDHRVELTGTGRFTLTLLFFLLLKGKEKKNKCKRLLR